MKIQFNRPSYISPNSLIHKIRRIIDSGVYTNGFYLRQLEYKAAEYLGVKDVVAVSSCTSGLMLIAKCLELEGEVITPSFSFSATSLALLWAGLKPVFVDCKLTDFNIDVNRVTEAITLKTSAILATHIFGNPCNKKRLERIARVNDIKLIFDAAHGFGSLYRDGSNVGSGGVAEVFSLAPSKLLTGGEGGLIATNKPWLADKLRIARNYGNPGNYNITIQGLNARMSELNAAMALTHLPSISFRILHRTKIAKLYQEGLKKLGIEYQTLNGFTNHSYFALKHPKRDKIATKLERAGIETKKYFDPPIHKQKLFRKFDVTIPILSNTLKLSYEVLCLPIYNDISEMRVSVILGNMHDL